MECSRSIIVNYTCAFPAMTSQKSTAEGDKRSLVTQLFGHEVLDKLERPQLPWFDSYQRTFVQSEFPPRESSSGDHEHNLIAEIF